MTYRTIDELPETLQTTLPKAAQEVYVAAYNDAMMRLEDRPANDKFEQSTAHAIAWRAVDDQFVQDPKSGKWYKRDDEGVPLGVSEGGGLMDRLKSLF